MRWNAVLMGTTLYKRAEEDVLALEGVVSLFLCFIGDLICSNGICAQNVLTTHPIIATV